MVDLVPGTNAMGSDYTIDKQIAEQRHEITMAGRVFGRQLADKRITQQEFDRKVGLRRAILYTLEQVRDTHHKPRLI